MKNYSEMSDFDINYSVAEKVLTFDEIVAVPMFGGAVRWSEVDIDGWNHFNPCNSWADAGPIIEEGLISLQFYQGSWMASVNPSQESGFRAACFIEKRNPLRAAMIVFLMMQEGV